MDRIEAIAAEIAEEAVGDAGLKANEIVGLVGKPSQRVLEYAENVGASYLVIGGRKRSSVGKVLFGSVTQSILLNAGCPVLTIMSE